MYDSVQQVLQFYIIYVNNIPIELKTDRYINISLSYEIEASLKYLIKHLFVNIELISWSMIIHKTIYNISIRKIIKLLYTKLISS